MMKTCNGCYKYDECSNFNKTLDIPCYEYCWKGVIRIWYEEELKCGGMYEQVGG